MSLRVFLVEDEPLVRRGLELLLSREPGVEVCGHASRQSEALAQILTLKPDLAIVDLRLAEGRGVDLIKELRAFGPSPKIIVFSMHTQALQVRAVLKAGANGFVGKEEGTESLLQAVRTVMQGKSFLTEAIASMLKAAPPNLRNGTSADTKI